MRILITGHKGFIGQHLINRKTDDVYCGFDIKCHGRYESKFNVWESQDIRKHNFIRQSIKNFSPDTVIHLAAMTGVRPSIDQYKDYYETNIIGTHNVLKACVESNVKNVLVASSSSVYGKSKIQPVNENSPLNPISPYGISKLGMEYVCRYFGQFIPISIFRPFTVYGENGRVDMAIPKLIECAKNKKTFYMYGDGNTSRGYTNVHDLVDGIDKLIHYIPNGCEIFNLGGQEEIKLKDLIALIKNELGDFPIEQVQQPLEDPDRNIANIDKAQKILNWKPVRDFKNEIKKLCYL